MEVSTQKWIITPRDNVQFSPSLMVQFTIPELILTSPFCLPSHRSTASGIHLKNGMLYLQFQFFRSVLDACKLWQDPSWSGGLNAQWITNCAQFSEHKVSAVHSFLSIPTCCAHACTHIYAQLLVFSHVLGSCATGEPIRKGLPNYNFRAYLIRLTLTDNIKHSTMIPAAVVQLMSKHNWSHLNESVPLNGHSPFEALKCSLLLKL